MRILGISHLAGPAARQAPGPALSDTEAALADLWHDVLGQAPVSPADHFFECGGHSLAVAQLIARVRERFDVEVAPAALFTAPTLGAMARSVEHARRAGTRPRLPPLTPSLAKGPAPLTAAQERMWLLHHLDPAGTAYTVAAAVRLRGPLDAPRLGRAVAALVRRHEGLRTAFREDDGALVQQPIDADAVLDVARVAGEGAGQREEEVQRLIAAEVRRPFHLDCPPLVRTTLYRLDDAHHVLLLVLPHIAADAWSFGVLFRELGVLYDSGADGLPALALTLRDVARWQRRWLDDAAADRLLAFWKDEVEGLEPLELPTDRPRPPVQSFDGAEESVVLPPALVEALRRVGARSEATLFMTLLAAFHTLLHRWTGSDDVAVGTPVAGRNAAGTEALVGAFVDTLVLRQRLGGNPTFRALLRQVRQTALEAYAHQDLPFARLIAALDLERDASRPPLVQVLFNLVQVPKLQARLGAAAAEPMPIDRGGAQFDLVCTVTEIGHELRLAFEYPTALFDRDTVRRLLGHFTTLLHAVAEDPDRPIGALPLLAPEQTRTLREAWSGPALPVPARALHEAFERQARAAPGAVALLEAGASVTAGELNAVANRLARHLRARGVGPGDRVAVVLDRSAEAVTGMMATLKTGAAYVPLDPQAPAARLGRLLQAAAPAAVLTRAGHPPLSSSAPVFLLDAADPAWADRPAHDLGVPVLPDDVAYVLYTSGSTGEPRGVEGTHRGALNRIAWMADAYPFGPREVVAHKTTLGFVDSVWEVFGPLAGGVPLAVVSADEARDPEALVDALEREAVTRLVVVPSLLRVLLENVPDVARRLRHLRVCVSSGERLTGALAAQALAELPHVRLLNLYGSTEVAADVTAYEVAAAPAGRAVPIGRPIANTVLSVEDAYGNPMPVGMPGELVVGGDGLARGYHGRPADTAARFTGSGDARRFRTGDLASTGSDGLLYYHGRRDRQVQVRGVRVEAAAVEAILREHPAVSACAVVAAEQAGGTELVAYPVLSAPATPQELRRHVAQHLPPQAVPALVVPLGGLPLTPSGKLDHRALPDPAARAAPGASAAAYVPPSTEAERLVASVWAEVFELDRVGRYDDFFDLGGHSLLAVRIAAQLSDAAGQPVPFSALVQNPTVAACAAYLSAAQRERADSPLLLLQPEGTRSPLFCVHANGGHAMRLVGIGRALAPERRFYAFESRGLRGEAPHASIEAMAAEYVEALRAEYPEGSILLGGYSFGGVVAFEMAHQLQRLGRPADRLVLIDAYAPVPAARALQLRHGGQYAAWKSKRVVRGVGRRLRQTWRGRAEQAAPPPPAGSVLRQAPPAAVEAVYAVRRANSLALRAYRARPLDVPALLVRSDARARRIRQRGLPRWHDLVLGPLVQREAPGTPDTMTRLPHSLELSALVRTYLDGAP